jgi:hypothetical protein
MKGFDPFSTTNSLYGVFYTNTQHPQTSYTKEFTRPDMPFAFYNQTQNMQQAYFNRLGHLIGKKPNVTEEQRNLTESQFNVQGAVKAKQLQNQFEQPQNINAYAPKKEERQSTFKKIGAQISNDTYHEPLLHYRPEATYKIPPFQKHLPYGYQPNLSPFQEYVTYAPGTNKVIGGTYLDTFDNYLPNVQRISQQQQQQTYQPVTVEQVPPQQTYQPPVQDYPPVQAVPQQTYQPPVQDYPPVQAEPQQTYQPPVQEYAPVQVEQVPQPQPQQQTYQTVTVEQQPPMQQTYQTVTVEQQPPMQQTYQPVTVEQVPPQFQEQTYHPPQENYPPVTLEQVPQPQLKQTYQTVTVEQQQQQMPVMEQTYQPAQETVTLVHATQPTQVENMEYRESIPPKHQVVYETTMNNNPQELEPLRPANVQGDYKIGSSLNASQGGLGPERTQVTYQQTGELEPLRPANVQGDYKIGSSLNASQGGMGGQLPQYTVVQQGEMEPLRAANVQGDYKIGSSYGQSGQKYVQNDISGLEPLRASNVRGDYKIGSSLMESA